MLVATDVLDLVTSHTVPALAVGPEEGVHIAVTGGGITLGPQAPELVRKTDVATDAQFGAPVVAGDVGAHLLARGSGEDVLLREHAAHSVLEPHVLVLPSTPHIGGSGDDLDLPSFVREHLAVGPQEGSEAGAIHGLRVEGQTR